jgi:anaphase-promoting complex subunit 4
MLPALDRCSVILSRFAGIAKFQHTNDSVGFSSHQINHIMDVIASLHLISSKIILQVVDELDLFAAFSSWLRYEIDKLASEASSSTTEEANEKESTINHSKVLLYVQTAMTNSPLCIFLGDAADYSKEGWGQLQPGVKIFDQVDQQLQKQEQGLPYEKQFPRVEFLCKILVAEASTVFSKIAEAEKRNVLFGKPKLLGVPRSDTPIDMSMCKMVGIALYGGLKLFLTSY